MQASIPNFKVLKYVHGYYTCKQLTGYMWWNIALLLMRSLQHLNPVANTNFWLSCLAALDNCTMTYPVIILNYFLCKGVYNICVP